MPKDIDELRRELLDDIERIDTLMHAAIDPDVNRKSVASTVWVILGEMRDKLK